MLEISRHLFHTFNLDEVFYYKLGSFVYSMYCFLLQVDFIFVLFFPYCMLAWKLLSQFSNLMYSFGSYSSAFVLQHNPY